MTLAEELASLPAELRSRLEARGFREDRLLAWASQIGAPRDARNRLGGNVTPPRSGDVVDAPTPGTPEHARLREVGIDLLGRGKVALCVLAGGMATRMGGVVKALVEALPGQTFLDLRLAEQAAILKHGAEVPLWLMTSEATDGPIRAALGDRLDGSRVATFEQCVSLRLTREGTLFREDDGEPSVYATGHGDLPEALARSGLLRRFADERGPESIVWLANLDNLGATIDPAMLGWFASRSEQLAVEVVDKVGSDRGGVPVVYQGRRIIAEEFRLPLDLDPSTIRVFNTNTFMADATALAALAPSPDSPGKPGEFEFTFVEVDKTVGEKKAIQFERLLGEITMAIEPTFIRVPRSGPGSRFLPVKDFPELEMRRPEIEMALRPRGVLG